MKADKVIKNLDNRIMKMNKKRDAFEDLVSIAENKYNAMYDLREEKVGRNNKIFGGVSSIIWFFLLIFILGGVSMTIPYTVAACIYFALFGILVPNNRKYNKLRKDALREYQGLIDNQVLVEQEIEYLKDKKEEILLNDQKEQDYDYQEVVRFTPEKPSILKKLLSL